MLDLDTQRAALDLVEGHIFRIEGRITQLTTDIDRRRLTNLDVGPSEFFLMTLHGLLEAYHQRRVELLRIINA